MAFEDNTYAEAARQEGGEFTEECLIFLGQHGEMGRTYLVEAVHSMGGTYFEDKFDSVEELKEDYERFKQNTEH